MPNISAYFFEPDIEFSCRMARRVRRIKHAASARAHALLQCSKRIRDSVLMLLPALTGRYTIIVNLLERRNYDRIHWSFEEVRGMGCEAFDVLIERGVWPEVNVSVQEVGSLDKIDRQVTQSIHRVQHRSIASTNKADHCAVKLSEQCVCIIVTHVKRERHKLWQHPANMNGDNDRAFPVVADVAHLPCPL